MHLFQSSTHPTTVRSFHSHSVSGHTSKSNLGVGLRRTLMTQVLCNQVVMYGKVTLPFWEEKGTFEKYMYWIRSTYCVAAIVQFPAVKGIISHLGNASCQIQAEIYWS